MLVPGEGKAAGTHHVDSQVRRFEHQKRPAWGVGHLTEDLGDRLRLAFEDGHERTLLKGIAALVEVEPDDKPPPRRPASGRETRTKPSWLIKAFRLAVRDGLAAAKSTGGYPDDTLIAMQKGLSRVTADHARFLGTTPDAVRRASARACRGLGENKGLRSLFDELADRLDDVDERFHYTRAFEQPVEAADHVRAVLPLIEAAGELTQDQLDELERLLTPRDRGEDI